MRHAGAVGRHHARIAVGADGVVEIAVGPLGRIDVIVAIGRGQPRAFLGDDETRVVAVALDVKPIMSASSSAIAVRLEIEQRGQGLRALRSARSQAFSSSRCLIDLTTEGSALWNSIAASAEFEQVAGLDAAGRAVEQVAVDHGAQLRRRHMSLPRIKFLISKPPSSLMVFSEAMIWVTVAAASENGSSSRS